MIVVDFFSGSAGWCFSHFFTSDVPMIRYQTSATRIKASRSAAARSLELGSIFKRSMCFENPKQVWNMICHFPIYIYTYIFIYVYYKTYLSIYQPIYHLTYLDTILRFHDLQWPSMMTSRPHSQVARVSWGSIDPNWTSPSRNFELKLLGWASKVPKKQQDIIIPLIISGLNRSTSNLQWLCYQCYHCLLLVVLWISMLQQCRDRRHWAVDRWCSTGSRASQLGRDKSPSDSWVRCTCAVVKQGKNRVFYFRYGLTKPENPLVSNVSSTWNKT